MHDWLVFFSSLAALVTAIFVWLKTAQVFKQVHQIHIDLNSRLTQLLAATGKAERAEGVKDEQARVAEEKK